MAANSTMKRMFDIRESVLDDDGNRTLDIELTALRTHPREVRKLLKADGPFELRYEVRRGEQIKRGSIDPDNPRLRLTFRAGEDPDGVWQLTVTAAHPRARWTRELWRQELFIQKRLRRDRERVHQLAARHAPVFVFSRAERYFPVSLTTLLASAPILECKDAMKIRTIFGRESIPLPSLGDFMRFNGHSNYLLDFNFLSMRRSIFASIGGDPDDATIYYSYLEDPDSDRFFINYHLIYAFDTKAGLAKLTGIGPHVFDRESMVLVFDGDEQPQSMIISGHLEDQTVFLLEKLKVWSQGRIAVRYDDPLTLKLDSHPVVAVAEGSHALYPTSGVYHMTLLREIAGYLHPTVMLEELLDPNERGPIRPEQVLMPPSVKSRRLPKYNLVNLGLDRITSHIRPDAEDYEGYNAYLAFSGYWVDVAGTQNARFPPFTRKESEIGDWVDGAYAWDWTGLPKRYHDNNGLILEFLRENLEDF